jgi:hypothetical protein
MTGTTGRVNHLNKAQDALNRMRRANERGTGCYLTPVMVEELSLTVFGEIWQDVDPRAIKADGRG